MIKKINYLKYKFLYISLRRLNINQPNQQMYTNMSLDITPTPSGINNNNSKFEFGKSLNQPVFDLQPNNSFNFDLSRGSSKNSLADFHFKLDFGKSSSFKFNNK